MANLNITNIPAPRVTFLDERTGLMSREWYRFFLNLFVLTGSGTNPTTLDDLQIGPPNQPELAELLLQINQNIAPQYEDQSGDFLATLDTAQLMSMMARFENAEAAIQGAYLQPVVQTGTIANYNLDGSPTAGGIAYGTGPALAVSAAGTLGQVLTSGGAGAPTWAASGGGGTVTSVAASVPTFLSVAGSPITTSGTLAITLSGTALPVLNGGTGVTTSTGSGNTVLSASPTFTGTVTAPAVTASSQTIGTTAANPLIFNINSTEAARFDTSSNLLMGTTGVTGGYNGKVINVFGSSTVRNIIQTTGQFAVVNLGSGGTSASPAITAFLLTDGTANTASVGTGTSTPFQFFTNNTEVARFDTSGNFLLATTSTPTSKLGVQGDAIFSNGGNVANAGGAVNFSANGVNYTPMAMIKGLLSNTASLEDQGNLAFYTRPVGGAGQTLTERVRITSAGEVGIGTSSPARTLDVTGTFGASGASTLGGALTYGGVTLSNSVTGTGSMVLSASPTFTGTVAVAAVTATSLALGGATLGTNALAVTGTTQLNSALNYGGVTLSNAVTGTGNMVLSASPTLTGTLTGAAANFTSIGATTPGTGAFTTVTTTGAVGIGMPTPIGILDITQTQNAESYARIQNASLGTSANAKFYAYNGSTSTAFGHLGQSFTTSGVLVANSGFINADADFAINVGTSKTLKFAVNNSEVARIDTSGNLLVGTTGVTGSLNGNVINVFGSSTVRNIVQTTGQYASVNVGSGGTSATPTTKAFLYTDGTANVARVGSGTSTPLLFDINNTEAARFDTSGRLQLSNALIYGGVTLSNAVTGTGSMVLSASPTLTGTLTAAAANFTSIGATTPGTGAFTTVTTTGNVTTTQNTSGTAAHLIDNTNTSGFSFYQAKNDTNTWAFGTGGTASAAFANAFRNTLAFYKVGISALSQGAMILSTTGLRVYPTTASTTTATGCLVLDGGLGVAGAIYAGSIQNTPIGATTASTGGFTTLSASSTATATAFIPSGSGIPTNGMYLPAANTVGFAINSTEAARFDTSSNLLIGTAGITAGLNGKVINLFGTSTVRNIVQTTGQYAVVNLGSGGTSVSPATTGFMLTDGTANTCVIGTGTNTPVNVISNSSGGVTLTSGSTAWAAISDETLKTDLATIQSGAEKVASLRAVTGRYKTDAESMSRSFLIAQDVQKVLPEAVSTDADGTLSLRYTEIIPLMVAAIQELTTRLAALENK